MPGGDGTGPMGTGGCLRYGYPPRFGRRGMGLGGGFGGGFGGGRFGWGRGPYPYPGPILEPVVPLPAAEPAPEQVDQWISVLEARQQELARQIEALKQKKGE